MTEWTSRLQRFAAAVQASAKSTVDDWVEARRWKLAHAEKAERQFDSRTHICTQCGYSGHPAYVSRVSGCFLIVLLCLWLLPGILYLLYAWGKPKRQMCPKCRAEGTMIPSGTPQGRTLVASLGAVTPTVGVSSARQDRPCPYCAEPILVQARVCKHCGRDVVPLVGT
jgi:rubrerythrin